MSHDTDDDELELVDKDIGATISDFGDKKLGKSTDKPSIQMLFLEVNPIGLTYLNLFVMFLTRFSIEINESIIL